MIGNLGTLILFQVGHDDAEELVGVMEPYSVERLTWLDRGQVAVRISTGGNVGVPFIGYTYEEVGEWFGRQRGVVIEQSRRRNGVPRRVVEDRLRRWAKSGIVREA